jgi:DNA polymerase I-like protein with 3'-5' exonuclease and polymerase domains
MPIVQTADLRQGEVHPFNDQVYNGLDCCLTLEVFEEISSLGSAPPVYDFSRALQAPTLAMMRRGFLVDKYERQKSLQLLREEVRLTNSILQQLAYAVWDKPLNPRSPKQLLDFFYRHMKLPEQYISIKGVRKLSMNKEVLEKLDLYMHARPILACIQMIRDAEKQIEDLEQSLRDGRYYTSFNIGGTETWRFSSSKSAYGTGGNLQNKKVDDDIEEGAQSMRRPFIADPGWKLCEIDLEQAEAREVGWTMGVLFDDWRYLDACEGKLGADLHTVTARMVWPDKVRNRADADSLFYRNFSYRQMSKRGGFLTNYMGTAWTASRSLKVPIGIMDKFQKDYATGPMAAFPAFPKWWRWVAEQLQTTQRLSNSFGVERMFFGRPNDDTTLREAIAHGPQSSTAMRTNLGLWRIWYYMPQVEVLAQKHDSVTFQFREEEDEGEIIAKALALMSTPLRTASRTFDVPGEAKVGWNWGRYDEKLNPNGMRKAPKAGTDGRRRLEGRERVL